MGQNVDMTAFDFDSLRDRLQQLAQSAFPEWTDFSAASFGNILLEMFAHIGDTLGFYIQNQARESRLETATQRKNVIALCRMLGYRLHGTHAATADVVFSLPRPADAEIVIPKGTVVRTREVTESLRFQLLNDVIISEGVASAVGTVEHSSTRKQFVDTQGIASLDAALSFAPYLDGSCTASSSQGTYQPVDTLLNSDAADRHFAVLVDHHDRATLRFGDGIMGAAPTGTLSIQYKTGGGVEGNVDAGRLVVLGSVIYDSTRRPAAVSVTNPLPASGGGDRQSIASARQLAVESLRATQRCITREDFEIHARRVAGVDRALMLTHQDDLSIEENTGVLVVVPTGGGMPTDTLRDEVLKQVTVVYPCPLTFQVRVQNPNYKAIDVSACVWLRDGYEEAEVERRIVQALRRLFASRDGNGEINPLIDFGRNLKAGELTLSDVFDAIHRVEGLRKISDLNLNHAAGDVVLHPLEFPTLGRVQITQGSIGATQ